MKDPIDELVEVYRTVVPDRLMEQSREKPLWAEGENEMDSCVAQGPVATKKPPIERGFDDVLAALCSCEGAHGALADRLKPVLMEERPVMEEAAVAKKGEPLGHSAVCTLLLEITNRLKNLQERQNALLKRIEV